MSDPSTTPSCSPSTGTCTEVTAANEHAGRPAPPGIIPLSCGEIRRLFIVLVVAPLNSRVFMSPLHRQCSYREGRVGKDRSIWGVLETRETLRTKHMHRRCAGWYVRLLRELDASYHQVQLLVRQSLINGLVSHRKRAHSSRSGFTPPFGPDARGHADRSTTTTTSA